MTRIATCSVYADRPAACREYPQPGHYRPNACTFWFGDEGDRQGECAEECGATCCAIPREGGEPGGAALPALAGGAPCKHLQYRHAGDEDAQVKEAAAAIRGLYDEGIDAIFDQRADDA